MANFYEFPEVFIRKEACPSDVYASLIPLSLDPDYADDEIVLAGGAEYSTWCGAFCDVESVMISGRFLSGRALHVVALAIHDQCADSITNEHLHNHMMRGAA